MCVYAYAYVHFGIRVCAYWADANYAYILVRIYLSCTVSIYSLKNRGQFHLNKLKAFSELKFHEKKLALSYRFDVACTTLNKIEINYGAQTSSL